MNWYFTVERIVRSYSPLPFEDYWRVPEHLNSYRHFDLRVLWKQHNEHRIVFPEIVYAADMLVGHGLQLIPLTLSFLCYVGVLSTLVLTLIQDRQITWPVRMAAVLLCALVIGWQGSAMVLAEPFLLQWTLMQVGVLLSLVFLSKATGTRKNLLLAGSIASAVVATYSSGNGMLIWPILLLAAFVLHLGPRQFASVFISAIISSGLYFIGYDSPRKLNLENFLRHPWYSIEFLGAYISMPFGGIKGPQFGVYVGLISIAIMVALCIAASRRGLIRSDVAIVLFGAYLFTLLTAVLTAAGRMDPADVHYEGAGAARYITLPLVNWAVFIASVLWVSARFHWKFFRPPAAALVISLLLFLGLPKLRWWLRSNEAQFADTQLTALSLETGLSDAPLLVNIFPDPEFVKRWLPELRAGRLSIYYRKRGQWLGKPVTSFAPILSGTGAGRITFTYPVRSGLEIAGWNEGARVLLTNEEDKILGFGEHLPAGFPDSVPAPSARPNSNWVGFANLSFGGKETSAYIITPAGLLRLAHPMPVPDTRAVDAGDIGNPLSGISWRSEPNLLSSALPPLELVTNPPGEIYSTWNGNDAKQGTIESTEFPVPAGGCFVLPVLPGPSMQGLSVEIIDGATGRVAAAAPIHDRSRWWAYWQFRLGPNVKTIRIRAQDHGTAWGQWIAVGQPFECR